MSQQNALIDTGWVSVPYYELPFPHMGGSTVSVSDLIGTNISPNLIREFYIEISGEIMTTGELSVYYLFPDGATNLIYRCLGDTGVGTMLTIPTFGRSNMTFFGESPVEEPFRGLIKMVGALKRQVEQ